MIQVHPQLEEGVTGHGVLPNQQMCLVTKQTRYLHSAYQRCKKFLSRHGKPTSHGRLPRLEADDTRVVGKVHMACCRGSPKRRPIVPLLALLALLAALGPLTRQAAASETLPQLGAAIDATSVSGLSSGAYMAGQIELAHSRQVVGVGIVAGGPFGCAESAAGRLVPYWPTAVLQNAEKALNGCMSLDWGAPDPGELATRAKELAQEGKIDTLDGLADDKVYLFSGSADRTVLRPVVEAAKSFYAKAGVPDKSVTLVEREGGHGFLTEDEGKACGLSESPFVNDCDYDQAKAILDWIYGPVAAPEAEPKGRYVLFDQSEFGKPGDGLAAEGVVYVPPACAAARAAAGSISCCMAASRHGSALERISSRSPGSRGLPTPTG